MANDWIIDVLADLKSYAGKNGLVALASQLDDAMLTAAAEISSTEDGRPVTALGHAGTIGVFPRDHRGR
jgi:hypothetical protein